MDSPPSKTCIKIAINSNFWDDQISKSGQVIFFQVWPWLDLYLWGHPKGELKYFNAVVCQIHLAINFENVIKIGHQTPEILQNFFWGVFYPPSPLGSLRVAKTLYLWVLKSCESRTMFKTPTIWDCIIELWHRSVGRLRPLSKWLKVSFSYWFYECYCFRLWIKKGMGRNLKKSSEYKWSYEWLYIVGYILRPFWNLRHCWLKIQNS